MKTSLALKLFTEALKNRNYAENSFKRYYREARDFLVFAGKEDVRELTSDDVIRYQKEIHHLDNYKAGTRRGIMNTISRFFRFLSRNGYILVNPVAGLDLLPEAVSGKRKSVDKEKLCAFLDAIDGSSFLDIRDRALFELMYGCGLRVGETVKLDMTDIDFQAGKVFVREAKGGRDRVVPVGETALLCVKKYVEQARSYLEEVVDTEALFLKGSGRRLTVAAVEFVLKKRYQNHFGDQHICPHMLRHSFATHMLEAGAGIKQVKDILGHKSIQSTVAYTHFDVRGMKKMLKQYHPRENELYEEYEADKRLENEK